MYRNGIIIKTVENKNENLTPAATMSINATIDITTTLPRSGWTIINIKNMPITTKFGR